MDQNMTRFHRRVTQIERASSARLPRNMHMRPDGLVVYRRPFLRFGIPWRSLILAVLCCFLLKGLMIWHQGTDAYQARLNAMQAETTGHQIAARLLSMDPVSTWIAAQVTAVVGTPPQ